MLVRNFICKLVRNLCKLARPITLAYGTQVIKSQTSGRYLMQEWYIPLLAFAWRFVPVLKLGDDVMCILWIGRTVGFCQWHLQSCLRLSSTHAHFVAFGRRRILRRSASHGPVFVPGESERCCCCEAKPSVCTSFLYSPIELFVREEYCKLRLQLSLQT